MSWLNNSVAAVWRLGAAIRGMADRPNELVTTQDLDKWLRFGGASSTAGVTVNVTTAQSLAAVAASVRVISDSISHLPLTVYRINGKKREPARDHRLYSILRYRPNEFMTSVQWRKIMVRDLCYRGNAYNLKVPGVGGIQGLIRLHPDRVTVKQDPTTLAVVFEYTRPNGERVVLSRDQVMHVWWDSDDGIVGMNPLSVYRESIGDGLAIREHGSRFFSNAARVSGVLVMQPGTKMGEAAASALRQDFESMYSGGSNAHKTAILPGGIEFKQVGISMEDAQWIETRKIAAREIYGIFGVPPHKAGDLADATFSNVEHMMLEFVIDSLTPRLVALEQIIERDLFKNDQRYEVKFNVDALLRGDSKSRAEALQIQRRNGIINANEWRQLEDLNPRSDAGGDEYIVEGNMRIQDGTKPAPAAPSPRASEEG